MLLIFLVLLRPPISRRSPLFVIICSTVFAILSVSVLIILIGLILVSYWSHIGLILVSYWSHWWHWSRSLRAAGFGRWCRTFEACHGERTDHGAFHGTDRRWPGALPCATCSAFSEAMRMPCVCHALPVAPRPRLLLFEEPGDCGFE